MAQRQTERDTYGGERGWQEGAGEKWTSSTHHRAHETGHETDPESARVLAEDLQKPRGGILEQLAEELGLRWPKHHK